MPDEHPTPTTDDRPLELPVKRVTGETLEDRLTANAYNDLLPARYMKKDANGEPVEDQEAVFERVAKNIALAEAVFEPDTPVTVTPDQIKPDHPRRGHLAGDVFGIDPASPYTECENLPESLDAARPHLASTEQKLTEATVSAFAYDTVVPKLPTAIATTVKDYKERFQELLERLAFMPNSPCIMNAGDELQMLSACFVMSPEDDIENIHSTATDAAKIFQAGGGTGYSFSNLRPYGDPVGSTGGIASGPITFMRTYDRMCETIAQGGARRGAQMGVMRVSHPDIIQFIHAKRQDVSLAHTLRLNDPDDYTHNSFTEALDEARDLITDDGKVPKHLRNAVEGHLSNFNISVGVTDDFMAAVKADEEYTLINPRTGDPHIATTGTKELYERFDLGEYVEVGEPLSLPARELWDRIIEGAHENGEPGVIYLDRVNDDHSFDVESTPTSDSSEYEMLGTNPCLTGDTEILLGDGSVESLASLANNDDTVGVIARNQETGQIVNREGIEPRKTKVDAEVVTVKTDGGGEITCTTDHKIRTPDGYVEAQTLSPGDQVITATHVGGPGTISTAPQTVRAIDPAGTADVYNITVKEHHNYFARAPEADKYINVRNCGEQPLLENEACNLGHINLSTVVDEDRPLWEEFLTAVGDEVDNFDGTQNTLTTDYIHDSFDIEAFDWSGDPDFSALNSGTQDALAATFLNRAIDVDELDRRITLGIRFLDNVVTMSDFPVEKIEQTVRRNRKIGLGIMGLAQLYIQLGVRYGSEAGNAIARQLLQHINHTSKWASHRLAASRGQFENWDDSKYASPTDYPDWFERQTGLDADEWADGFSIRNHETTTIAPTGSTSMLGNTSAGCEPIYSVAYFKNVSEDVQGDEMLVEFDDYFLRVLKANDIDVSAVRQEAEQLMAANDFEGIESLSTVPDSISDLFVTTADLSAREHAAVQCACQTGVGSAISKTINAPADATLADTEDAFQYVYDHGGKGVTYYRDGTRSKQVLTTRAQNTTFSDTLDDIDPEEARDRLLDHIDTVFDDGLGEFLSELPDTIDIPTLIDDEQPSPPTAEVQSRPDTLPGRSQQIKTGYGKMYVTINEDPETGQPFEVFANIGHSGGFTNSFTEALGKACSIALRAGVDPETLVDELCGTRSPKVAWDSGEQIRSIPDAIGTALQRHLNQSSKQPTETENTTSRHPDADQRADGGQPASETSDPSTTDAVTDLIQAGENPECPSCGALSLEYSEGCKTCGACGWSEC